MKTLLEYNVRQSELKEIMAASDKYASKCYKLGISFAETYPDKYAEYVAANEEYNANEIAMQPLIEESRVSRETAIDELKTKHRLEREARKAALLAKKNTKIE